MKDGRRDSALNSLMFGPRRGTPAISSRPVFCTSPVERRTDARLQATLFRQEKDLLYPLRRLSLGFDPVRPHWPQRSGVYSSGNRLEDFKSLVNMEPPFAGPRLEATDALYHRFPSLSIFSAFVHTEE